MDKYLAERNGYAVVFNTSADRVRFWFELTEDQLEQIHAMFKGPNKSYYVYCLGTDDKILCRRWRS